MSTELKYQPEDIEFILLNKEYHDLDQEQKAFMSEFVDSEDEYLLMRGTLLNITQSAHPEVDIVPAYSIKDALMAEFDKEEQRAGGWLTNVLGRLFPQGQPFARKPGVQLSFMVCTVVLVAVLIPWNELSQEQNNVAQHVVIGDRDDNQALEQSIIVELDSSKELTGNVKGLISSLANDSFQVGNNGVVTEPNIEGKENQKLELGWADKSILEDDESIDNLKKDQYYWSFGDQKNGLDAEIANKPVVSNPGVAFYNSVADSVTANGFTMTVAGSSVYDELDEVVADPTEDVVNLSSKSMLSESISIRNKNGRLGRFKKGKFNKLAVPAKTSGVVEDKYFSDLPKLSRSIGEDSELIELLFTAM
ncbi:MAG: hypothetical protein JKY54_15970 [Flavobacteriales bacterium]|nr:hypothetical protein [Flavobacteriales bacterium]